MVVSQKLSSRLVNNCDSSFSQLSLKPNFSPAKFFGIDKNRLYSLDTGASSESLSLRAVWRCLDCAQLLLSYWSKLAAFRRFFFLTVQFLTVHVRIKSLAVEKQLIVNYSLLSQNHHIESKTFLTINPGLTTVVLMEHNSSSIGQN